MTQLVDESSISAEDKGDLYSKHLKPLDKWTKEDVQACVSLFLKYRFPTLFVLNKIDNKSSTKYINKFYEKYDPDNIVLTSALSECFLKNMKKKGYILYNEGESDFKTYEECEDENEKVS